MDSEGTWMGVRSQTQLPTSQPHTTLHARHPAVKLCWLLSVRFLSSSKKILLPTPQGPPHPESPSNLSMSQMHLKICPTRHIETFTQCQCILPPRIGLARKRKMIISRLPLQSPLPQMLHTANCLYVGQTLPCDSPTAKAFRY